MKEAKSCCFFINMFVAQGYGSSQIQQSNEIAETYNASVPCNSLIHIFGNICMLVLSLALILSAY